ncbi:MAG: aminoacyl-tRNA hydrolase [Patescibacteria group bacterium]
MSYSIVGLGNPGEEYEGTRHNTGRAILSAFQKKEELSEWERDKKLNALISEGKVGKEKILLILPETFMNLSGKAVKPVVTSAKKAERLIVVHDDLDLPLGKLKISFNKGSGGHKGVESIMRAVKTKAFIRMRVGVSPATPSGKLKKPHGEKKVGDFILGAFSPSESRVFKKISGEACEALTHIVSEGHARAASMLGQ